MEVVEGPINELNWKLLERDPEREIAKKISIIKNIYLWGMLIFLAFLAIQNYIEIYMYLILLFFFICIPMFVLYIVKDTIIENNSIKLKNKIKVYFIENKNEILHEKNKMRYWIKHNNKFVSPIKNSHKIFYIIVKLEELYGKN